MNRMIRLDQPFYLRYRVIIYQGIQGDEIQPWLAS
jgi:hypothetical protein